MFQSIPSVEPNPEAYEIEGAPYGAVTAFPNLGSRKRLANELEWARVHGVQGTELTEGADEETIRRVSERFAGQECLYVVTVDGRMFLIPMEVDGEATTHTMAAGGCDVIAAGHVVFGPDGKAVRWSPMSGHYRPAARQSMEVAEAIFRETGLRHPGGLSG